MLKKSSEEVLPERSQRTSALTRRNLLIGSILLGASGIAYARQPEVAAKPVKTKEFQALAPKQFGEWQSVTSSDVVLPPPDTLRDRLYDNLVTRTYVSDQATPVMLLLAYNNAQDGVLQVHRPEVCYPVGGFALSDTQDVPITNNGSVIPANFFTAVGPDRVEQVAYFTRLGSAYPRTWAEQRLAVMKANLDGDIPDGMLMRVSLLGKDSSAAFRQLERFASQFISASPPRLRKLLVVNA